MPLRGRGMGKLADRLFYEQMKKIPSADIAHVLDHSLQSLSLRWSNCQYLKRSIKILYKRKGPIKQPDNYRGISQQCVPLKIFNWLINQ